MAAAAGGAADPALAAVVACSGDSSASRGIGAAAVRWQPLLPRDVSELDFGAALEERLAQLRQVAQRHGLQGADPSGKRRGPAAPGLQLVELV